MTSLTEPSTPLPPPIQPAVSTPPVTGTWRHPKFDEIAQRQNAANFSDANIRRISLNTVPIVGIWILGWALRKVPQNHALVPVVLEYSQYPFLAIRLLAIFNILAALYPLMRRKDDLSDIPLTPSQRFLLGLDPSVTPVPTPDAQYFTPPRYPRSSTPRGGTPGSRGSSYSSSPLAGKSIWSSDRSKVELPFSPSANPWLQRSLVGGSRDLARRSSYGSPSPLGASTNGNDTNMLGVASTPSPTSGKGASVGLNSRWLYERGRSSPGNREMYS
ncbi:MAG: hypothetical protein M1812_000316 [Candelaria pacifica]|nr:MAG: hypothetical protein M1812_000316 [Candelaria pacifica]